MEITNFLTWFILIAVVAGIGLGSMIWAYLGAGSTSVLFDAAIPAPPLPSSLEQDAQLKDYFQQGYDAYQAGKYRQAIDKFSQAIERFSSFAEAYHNLGLAFANLRQDDNAVENLLRAGEFYAQQDKQAGIATIKQNLEALKARKRAN